MLYVKSNDGTKIAVYDPNPQGKDTILFIHGWPLSHKIFEYQENLLLDTGFRVITLDLRGFGNSDAPKEGYAYDQMAKDIYIIVETLGLTQFVLAGFSMGGAIALRYMKNYHGYGVKKLMLLAAAAPSFTERPGFPYGVTKESVDKLIEQARTDRPMLCESFSHTQLFAQPHSEALLNWFEDIALSASGNGTIQAAISLRDENGIEDLSYVFVPTAVFHGEKDLVVPNDLAMVQYNSIPYAKMYSFPDSGHGIMYDDLEEFNNYMLDFLYS